MNKWAKKILISGLASAIMLPHIPVNAGVAMSTGLVLGTGIGLGTGIMMNVETMTETEAMLFELYKKRITSNKLDYIHLEALLRMLLIHHGCDVKESGEAANAIMKKYVGDDNKGEFFKVATKIFENHSGKLEDTTTIEIFVDKNREETLITQVARDIRKEALGKLNQDSSLHVAAIFFFSLASEYQKMTNKQIIKIEKTQAKDDLWGQYIHVDEKDWSEDNEKKEALAMSKNDFNKEIEKNELH